MMFRDAFGDWMRATAGIGRLRVGWVGRHAPFRKHARLNWDCRLQYEGQDRVYRLLMPWCRMHGDIDDLLRSGLGAFEDRLNFAARWERTCRLTVKFRGTAWPSQPCENGVEVGRREVAGGYMSIVHFCFRKCQILLATVHAARVRTVAMAMERASRRRPKWKGEQAQKYLTA